MTRERGEAPDFHDLYRQLGAEHVSLNDRYMRLLNERGADYRSAQTAARRMAWSDVANAAQQQVFDDAEGPIEELCSRILALPDRPSRDRMQALRDAAKDLLALKGEIRKTNPVRSLLAENERIRDAARVQAARLHFQYGQDGRRCDCPGCELIQFLDDIGETSDQSGLFGEETV